MRAKHADDEPIDAKLVPRSGKRIEDLVSAKVLNKKDATLAESEYKLVVELTGSEIREQRSCGLDLVILLEVSDRMRGTKMAKLKKTINFLIKKLSPIDRLSVIKFTTIVERLGPYQLMSMTEAAQSKVVQQVNQLDGRGREADIVKALQMGLQVLEDRRLKAGRTSAIMLFSDGIQCSYGGNPTEIPLYDVPVHTFGLGDYQNTMVLKQIAENSKKGTYSSVVDHEGSDPASLSIAFSTCLAGILTEVVQEMQLTISTKIKINKVCTGSYTYEQKDEDGSVIITIPFGNLYSSEKRTILIDVQLPVADRPTSDNELALISYSFRRNGDDTLYESPSIPASVSRTDSLVSPECEGVIVEEARQRTVAKITEAIDWKQRYDGAQKKLEEAEKILDSLDDDDGNELITGLKLEVKELRKLSRNKESFEKAGRAFGLASVLSHNMQRFAIRGEADMKMLSYATPLATVFATQAKKFDKNCSIIVPTTEQDMEKCAADDDQNAPITDPTKQVADPIKLNAVSAKASYNKPESVSNVVSANEPQSLCQKIQNVSAEDNDKGKPENLDKDDGFAKDGNAENPKIQDTVSAKDANSIGEERDLSKVVVTPKQADEDEQVNDVPKCGDEKPKILDTIAAEFDENPKKLVHQGTDVDEVIEKVDRIRQAVEGVTKCLKALLNLGTTLQALLPALLFFFGFLNKYLDTKSSD